MKFVWLISLNLTSFDLSPLSREDLLPDSLAVLEVSSEGETGGAPLPPGIAMGSTKEEEL